MCFSQEASFGVGGILLALGTANVLQVLFSKVPWAQKLACIPFATVPLCFGTQQISEGFVWHSNLTDQNAIRCFTFFAYPFWPGIIPFAVALMEINRPRRAEDVNPIPETAPVWSFDMLTQKRTNLQRRVLLTILSIIGFAVFAYLMKGLVDSDPIKAHLLNYRIAYKITFPLLGFKNDSIPTMLACGLYLLVIIGCFFVSSVRHSRKLGVAIAASLIVSVHLWAAAFPSTWCFFSACISSYMLYIINCELAYRDLAITEKAQRAMIARAVNHGVEKVIDGEV